MTKPTLYIHIGVYKTGTTYIQRALEVMCDDMKKEGIILLDLPDICDCMYRKNTVDNDIIEKGTQFFNTALENKGDSYIISWEGFCGNADDSFSNSSMMAKVLKSMTESFEPHIILYVRRQDRFAESYYTLRVMQGEDYTFEEFIQENTFNWYDLATSFANEFGENNIHVKTYDSQRLRKAGGLLEDFADVIRTETLKHADIPSRTNSGLSSPAVELARQTNTYLSDEETQKVRYTLLRHGNTRQRHENSTFFTPNERRTYIQNYYESNMALAEKYLSVKEYPFYMHDVENAETEEKKCVSHEELHAVIVRTMADISERTNLVSLKLLARFEKRMRAFLDRHPFIKRKIKAYLFKINIFK